MTWRHWASLGAMVLSFALALAVAWSYRLARTDARLSHARRPIVVIVTEDAVYPSRLTLRVDTAYDFLLTGVGGSFPLSLPGLGFSAVAPAERIAKVTLTPRVLGRFSHPQSGGASWTVTVTSVGEPDPPQEELALIAVAGQLVPDDLAAPAGRTIRLSAVSLGGPAVLAIEGSGLTLQIQPHAVASVSMAAPRSGTFLYSLIGRWHGKGVLRFFPRAEDATPKAAIGEQAPPFAATELSGRLVELDSLLDRPVLIVFWSSWCAPCRAQLPLIEEAYERQGEQVRVLSVMVSEPRGRVARFAAAFQLRFPILLDEGGQLAGLYAIEELPTAIFLDPAGIIRVRYEGELTPPLLSRFFAEAGADGYELSVAASPKE
ncbi:MAG TPA: TlpA disulfide reductase family protein [Limnochordia bacterium]